MLMKIVFLKGFFPLIFIPLLLCFGCSKENKKIIYDRCSQFENGCINKNIKLEILTNRGSILIELDAINAPITASNFVFLANRGLYDGTYFDRSIQTPYPFLIQGGHKEFKYEFENNKKSYINERSISIKSIPLEIKLKGEIDPRYNQMITNSDNFKKIILKHESGSLAMARSQSLDSARIKFYITLKETPELDGRYAVFGKVINGFEVLDNIQEGDLIVRVKEFRNN